MNESKRIKKLIGLFYMFYYPLLVFVGGVFLVLWGVINKEEPNFWFKLLSDFSIEFGISLGILVLMSIFFTSHQERIQREISQLSPPENIFYPVHHFELSSGDASKLYDVGITNIKNAKHRLLVFERTPSLFLGPNPSDDRPERSAENVYYNNLVKWINDMKNDQDRECAYIFNGKETLKEFKDPSLEDVFKKNYIDYIDIKNEIGERFRFKGIEENIFGKDDIDIKDNLPVCCSIIIADDCVNFGIDQIIGGINIKIENYRLANLWEKKFNEVYLKNSKKKRRLKMEDDIKRFLE